MIRNVRVILASIIVLFRGLESPIRSYHNGQRARVLVQIGLRCKKMGVIDREDYKLRH